MGKITEPNKVKFFFGLIFNDGFNIKEIYELLEKKFNNKIDIFSPVIDFSFTKYYNKEMGENLKRQWISFETHLSPELLAEIKVETNNIEDSYAVSSPFVIPECLCRESRSSSALSSKPSYNRVVNIDPGYITPANVILASTKDFSHRIYLSKGIYSEVTTIYRKEGFTKLPWTYPDYLCPTATEFILQARKCILNKK